MQKEHIMKSTFFDLNMLPTFYIPVFPCLFVLIEQMNTLCMMQGNDQIVLEFWLSKIE